MDGSSDAATLSTPVVGAGAATSWVCCDRCGKWRIVAATDVLPDQWYCELNGDTRHNSCDKPEQDEEQDEVEPLPPDVYQVERLLSQRWRKGTKQFKVRCASLLPLEL
eukprot:6769527-Prymnesium_polylepis.1